MEQVLNNYFRRVTAHNAAFLAALLKPLLEGPAPNSILGKTLRRIAINSDDKELGYTVDNYKNLVEELKQSSLQEACHEVLAD